MEIGLAQLYTCAGAAAGKKNVNDHMEIYWQQSLTLKYVGLRQPVGRMSADDLLKIAQLSNSYGTSELRLALNKGCFFTCSLS